MEWYLTEYANLYNAFDATVMDTSQFSALVNRLAVTAPRSTAQKIVRETCPRNVHCAKETIRRGTRHVPIKKWK